MRKQLLSFKNAFKGILSAIKSEGHFRFHLVAAFYVIVFSLFYDFSAAQYAVLLVLIAAVLACELINTSIERLCDLVADRYEPCVKAAKDICAGAVLVLSVAAVVVAALFFWDTAVIAEIIGFFCENIWLIVLLALSVVLSVFFVVKGFDGFKSRK